ncbi:MAG: hypothetical protein LCH46_06670 [Proteobacteria bacterium]|nr:hypothetical protein [Pseudomonadota bacterium]
MQANWISFDDVGDAGHEAASAGITLPMFLRNLSKELKACEDTASRIETLLSETMFQSQTASLSAPWQLQSLDLLRQILGDLAMAVSLVATLKASDTHELDPAILSVLKLARVRSGLMSDPVDVIQGPE